MRTLYVFFELYGFPMKDNISNSTQNSIQVIYPYLHKGTWVFDDEDKCLFREPFIAGIDQMITNIVGDENLDESGFTLFFSSSPMPGFNFLLNFIKSEHGGNWYYSPKFRMEGWLCPAFYKYFKSPPSRIYLLFRANDSKLILSKKISS